MHGNLVSVQCICIYLHISVYMWLPEMFSFHGDLYNNQFCCYGYQKCQTPTSFLPLCTALCDSSPCGACGNCILNNGEPGFQCDCTGNCYGDRCEKCKFEFSLSRNDAPDPLITLHPDFASMVLANERRCYISNIFSHWPRPCTITCMTLQ